MNKKTSIIFFVFIVLVTKGTFVTSQMGQERLLATSNKSLIFKNQMKKYVSEKKRIKFCDLSTT
jgi:hypothetical protein